MFLDLSDHLFCVSVMFYHSRILDLFQSKLLEKELEMATKSLRATGEDFSQVEENHRQLEKQLSDKSWELKDVTAMKDARYGNSFLDCGIFHSRTFRAFLRCY